VRYTDDQSRAQSKLLVEICLNCPLETCVYDLYKVRNRPPCPGKEKAKELGVGWENRLGYLPSDVQLTTWEPREVEHE
jgi:hypothetical protein